MFLILSVENFTFVLIYFILHLSTQTSVEKSESFIYYCNNFFFQEYVIIQLQNKLFTVCE